MMCYPVCIDLRRENKTHRLTVSMTYSFHSFQIRNVAMQCFHMTFTYILNFSLYQNIFSLVEECQSVYVLSIFY